MTKYCARFYFPATDREITMEFDSATERALAIIGYSAYSTVLDTSEVSPRDDAPADVEADALP